MKSSTFNLVFLAVFLLSISGSTLARMQPIKMMMMNELQKDQMMQQLDAYKKIIATAATKEVGLLKMVGGAQEQAQQCLPQFSYCNTDKDCCSGRCREDDEQEYYSGRATCF